MAKTSFPREIEDFLYTHPAVEQVEVIGVPDEKYGEEVCAWIKLREGQEVTVEGDPRLLPRPDRPLQDPAIHVKFVEEFPMTITGKVQKFEMRERMMKSLRQQGRQRMTESRISDPTRRFLDAAEGTSGAGPAGIRAAPATPCATLHRHGPLPRVRHQGNRPAAHRTSGHLRLEPGPRSDRVGVASAMTARRTSCCPRSANMARSSGAA